MPLVSKSDEYLNSLPYVSDSVKPLAPCLAFSSSSRCKQDKEQRKERIAAQALSVATDLVLVHHHLVFVLLLLVGAHRAAEAELEAVGRVPHGQRARFLTKAGI